MTNVTQFLKTFARKLGISDSEGRLGLEIFSKIMAVDLKPGDSIEIDGLGFFTFKKIRATLSASSDELDKILIVSEQKTIDLNSDILLFFFPAEVKNTAPQIDSFVNLSFNKPLLISNQAEDTEVFFSLSYDERISLIESKAEKLFSESKVYKRADESEAEFIFAQGEEKIIFDTTDDTKSLSESNTKFLDHEEISHVSEIKDTADSYELVQSDKVENYDISDADNKEKAKLVFDDFGLKKELNISDESLTADGFAEVNDNVLIPHPQSIQENEETDLGRIGKSTLEEKLKSSKSKKVIAFVSVLVIAAAAIFGFLNFEKIKTMISPPETPPRLAEKKNSTPEIINRNFDILVTYPYVRDGNEFIQTSDTMIISSSVFHAKQDSGIQNLITEPKAEIDFDQELIRVAKNIYQQGDAYFVQISSWRSKRIAVEELNRFSAKGFITTLDESYNNEGVKIYKVMVGSFKNLDETKNFLNQNK